MFKAPIHLARAGSKMCTLRLQQGLVRRQQVVQVFLAARRVCPNKVDQLCDHCENKRQVVLAGI